MIFTLDDVVTSEELDNLRRTLEQAQFIDGKTTAGWHAKLVKNNMQLDKTATNTQALQNQVKAILKRNTLFQSAVLPKKIHSILFSC